MKIKLLRDAVVNGSVHSPHTEHTCDDGEAVRLINQGAAVAVKDEPVKRKATKPDTSEKAVN